MDSGRGHRLCSHRYATLGSSGVLGASGLLSVEWEYCYPPSRFRRSTSRHTCNVYVINPNALVKREQLAFHFLVALASDRSLEQRLIHYRY